MSEQVVCDGCGILVDRNKYERHIKYGHKDKRDHVCELCHKKFSSKLLEFLCNSVKLEIIFFFRSLQSPLPYGTSCKC